MRRILTILYLGIFLFSCQIKEDNNNLLVDPYTSSVTTIFNVDSLSSSSRILELETNNTSVLGKINCISISEKMIFIHDNMQKCIMVFDINGEFIRRLVIQGDGPSEVGEFSDMCLSSNNDYLAVLDTKKLMVLIFSTSTFSLIKSFPIDGRPRQIMWPTEGFILFSPHPFNYHNDGYKISILDESGNTVNRIGQAKVSRRALKTLTAFHSIFKTPFGFAFWDVSMSDVNECVNGEVQNWLTFEPWDKKKFREKWDTSIGSLEKRLINDLLFTKLLYFNNNLYINGIDKKLMVRYLFCFKDKNLYQTETSYPKSQYSKGINGSQEFPYPFWPSGVTSNGKYMYQIIDRFDLIQFKESQNAEFENFDKQSSDISKNPLILIKW